MTLNVAVVKPIPSASVRSAVARQAGCSMPARPHAITGGIPRNPAQSHGPRSRTCDCEFA